METLDQLTTGQSAYILSIHSNKILQQRLFDLGFQAGTLITCLHENHWKDFKAYRIRKTVIALRIEDAKQIEILEIESFLSC